MTLPLTAAVRNATELEAAEKYEEADSRYLFVLPQLGMFLNTVYAGRELTEHVHHDHHQFVYILEGEGQGRIGDRSVPLTPGISIRIPAGVTHSWRNTGVRPLSYVEVKVPARPDPVCRWRNSEFFTECAGEMAVMRET